MELVRLLTYALMVGLLVGLLFRNKGDNTTDTLSKGCGFLLVGVIVIIILVVIDDEGILNKEEYEKKTSKLKSLLIGN